MKPAPRSRKGYIVPVIILPLIIAKTLSIIYEGASFANIILLLMRASSLAVFAFIATGLGSFLLRRMNLSTPCSIFNFCCSMATGFVLISYLTFLSLIRVGGIPVFLPLWFVALYFSFKEVTLYWNDILPKSPDRFKDLKGFDLAAVFVLCLLFSYALYTALTPPFSWDAQAYHLFIPKTYLAEKGFAYIPLNVYSNMPLNIDIIYLAAMFLGDDVTPKLVHLAMGFLLCLSLYAFGRRYFSPRTGILAPLLFLCNPAVFSQLGIAYIDVGLALFCFWMMACLVEYIKTGKIGYVFLMGVFCGMCLGSKYTMIFAFISAGVSLLFSPFILSKDRDSSSEKNEEERDSGVSVKALGVFVIVSVALLSPWLIKNLLYVGNPVYPMLFGVLGGRDWSAQQSSWLIDWQRNIGMGRSLFDYLSLPLRIFYPVKRIYGYRGFAGALFPYVAMTLPLALMSRRNRGILKIFIFFFVLFFIQWALGSQQIRFLIPALSFPALCAAAGVDILSRHKIKFLSWIPIALIILCPLHLLVFHILPEINREGSYFPVLIGRQTREEFLRPRVRSYPCFEHLLSRCDEHEPVLFLFENKSYYCPQPAYADSMFEASYFLNLALESQSPQEFRKRLRKFDCRYVVTDQLIRKGMRLEGEAWILSKKENREKLTKALDITETFIETYLVKEFEENFSTVYRFK